MTLSKFGTLCIPSVLLLFITFAPSFIKAASPTPDEAKSSETALLPFTITGQITAIDGSAIGGAHLEIFTYSGGHGHLKKQVMGEAISSPGGIYSISGTIEVSKTRGSSVVLSASKQGYVSLLCILPEFMAAADVGIDVSNIERNVVMPRSASLEGTVTSDKGNPLAQAVITGVADDIALKEGVVVNTAVTTSSVDGSFKLDGLPDGEVNLSVILDGRSVLFTTTTAPVKDLRLVVSSTGSTVTGSVITPDGTPVPMAEITLQRAVVVNESGYSAAKYESTTTDARGQFGFENIPGGDYRLYARSDGLHPLAEDFDPVFFHLEPGETTSGIRLRMYNGTTITGKITDAESGKPIAGVTVYWGDPDHGVKVPSGDSDSNGIYKIEGAVAERAGAGGLYVKAPHHVLRVSNDDKALAAFGRSNVNYKTVKLPMEGEDLSVNLELTPTDTVSGIVRDENGAAMAGVEMFIGNMWYARGAGKPPAVTDADGHFTLQASPEKGLKIYAAAKDRPVVSVPAPAPGDDASFLTITVYPPAAISGMVIGPDGQAVGNANIQVNRNDSPAETGMASNLPPAQVEPNGTFAIQNLPAGKISLLAQKEGFVPSEFLRLELKPGEQRSGVTLRLGKGYTIKGRITDPQGRPVPDVRVTVDAADPEKHVFANTQSGLDGRYTLTGVPDIMVTLKFWAPRAGLNGEIKNVRPSAGGARDIMLKAD